MVNLINIMPSKHNHASIVIVSLVSMKLKALHLQPHRARLTIILNINIYTP